MCNGKCLHNYTIMVPVYLMLNEKNKLLPYNREAARAQNSLLY